MTKAFWERRFKEFPGVTNVQPPSLALPKYQMLCERNYATVQCKLQYRLEGKAQTLERLGSALERVQALEGELSDANAVLVDAESDYIDADQAYQAIKPTLRNRQTGSDLLGVIEPPTDKPAHVLERERYLDARAVDAAEVEPKPVDDFDEPSPPAVESDDFDNWESAEPASAREEEPLAHGPEALLGRKEEVRVALVGDGVDGAALVDEREGHRPTQHQHLMCRPLRRALRYQQGAADPHHALTPILASSAAAACLPPLLPRTTGAAS
jgi:hypothetical protein